MRLKVPSFRLGTSKTSAGIKGDDEDAGDFGEIYDEVLGSPVGEVLLLLIARHVSEGKHSDNWVVRKRQRALRTCSVWLTAGVVVGPMVDANGLGDNPAVSLSFRIGGISIRNSPEIEPDMLERTARLTRLQAVSNHQHEIGTDRGVGAEIIMAVAGRFAFEIDDGHARRVGLHPPDLFLVKLADHNRPQTPARAGEEPLGDTDRLVARRRV